MTVTLALEPREEARLLALAKAKGLTADALLREFLGSMLAEAPTEDGSLELPLWDLGVVGTLHRRDIYDDVT